MALPFKLSGTDDWPGEILATVKAEWNVEWKVVTPGTTGTYNPVTDTHTGATSETVVMDWREGRCQSLLNPRKRSEDWGLATERTYLFQGEIKESDAPILEGMQVKVKYKDGAVKRDPEIEDLIFRVIGATNSGHAAVRTVYAVSDMAR